MDIGQNVYIHVQCTQREQHIHAYRRTRKDLYRNSFAVCIFLYVWENNVGAGREILTRAPKNVGIPEGTYQEGE